MQKSEYKIKLLFFYFTLAALFLGFTGILLYENSNNKRESYIETFSKVDINQEEIIDDENDNIEKLDLYALSAALIDGDSGRLLYNKDSFTQRPMASTTKIMTLIVALENCDSNDIVKISSSVVGLPDVKLCLEPGEKYKLGDLYYSLMLESHNDTAVAIAEHVGGSVKDFAKLMNDKAKEIGLNHTYFITPNGLDASDKGGIHSTCAHDLAQIMRYCVNESPKREEFIDITKTREKSFQNMTGNRIFYVYNKNKYLDMNSNAISGKTGFTCDAGYCYVAALKSDQRLFIISLLGCGWPNNKNYKWKDMKKLVDYAEENYQYKEIISNDYETGKIKVSNGIKENGEDAFCIDTYTDASLTLLVSKYDKIVIKKTICDNLLAPVSEKEIVGKIDIFINGYVYQTYNIYSKEKISRKDFMYWIEKVANQYMF